MLNTPDTIYLEKQVRTHPLTERILGRVPKDVPTTIIEDYKNIGLNKPFLQRANEDKNSLALAEKKGDLIKSIGRMREDQFYLFHEIDCKYDCEYCYLQYYFQTKVPVIFVNRDRVLEEIESILKTRKNPYFHVGEVCDSLAFDSLTDFSKDIAALFLTYENGKVEFRTKSTNVENLVSLSKIPRNLIPSWTMSPEFIVDKLEHKTPRFKDRLEAAKKCQKAGYTVGIRFDPIFKYAGWEENYKEMVFSIFNTLNPNLIDYVSLGTVKMHKNLVDIISKRFPDSITIQSEIVPSDDGKYRPIKFDRVDIYRKMTSWIKDIYPEIKIELSLESADTHELVFS